MNTKKFVIVAAILVVFFITVCLWHHPIKTPTPVAVVKPATNVSAQAAVREPLQKKAKQLTPEEKAKFLGDFETRYKPAIAKWFAAYGAHVPFNADDVTPDKFIARAGFNDSYREYVFKVDDITLSVRDQNGNAEVDYLNNPEQTKQLSALPQRAQAPTTQLPVQRQDVTGMVLADSGTQYPPDQIRMIPSGFSGSMDGGALVHIGGNPHNGASWKFDMVFGPDGKLAYYLRGL